MSSRTLLFAMIATVIVMGVLIAVWIARSNEPAEEGGITFRGFGAESTATVAFVGEFPPEEDEALRRPLAVDGDGERLFVVDGDAGVIVVYSYTGAVIDTLTVGAASGAAAFYPVDVAVLSDGRVAVVDASASQVVVIDPDAPEEVAQFGATDQVPGQPTAIDAEDGMVAIADATTAAVRIFKEDGTFVRDLGTDLDAPLTFVGGLDLDGDRLYVSDSNAGRVLILNVTTGELEAILEQRFELPRGLTPVIGDQLAIVEGFAGRIVVFSVDDQQQTDLVGDERTEYYEEGGGLTTPEAVYWDDPNDRLYVADPSVGRIKVYQLREPVEGSDR